MLQIFKNTHFDFIKVRKFSYIVSAVVFVLSAVSLVFLWNTRQGIDFTGGTIIRMTVDEGSLTTSQIRSVIQSMGIGRSIIQETSNERLNGYIIRLPIIPQDTAGRASSSVASVDSALIKFVEEYGRPEVELGVFAKADSSQDIRAIADSNLLEIKGYSIFGEDTAFLMAGDFSGTITGIKKLTYFDSLVQLTTPLDPAEKTLDKMRGRGIDSAVVFLDAENTALSVRVFVDPVKWDSLEKSAYPETQGEGEISNSIDIMLKEELENRDPNLKLSIEGTEHVGARMSSSLRMRTLWVVLLGIAVILGYISIRFTYRFGIASVVALLHDVVITAGVYAVSGFEFNMSTIAALLTLIGYSINDSIIVSDRIREVNRMNKGKDFKEVVNASINATLSRTIMTAFTTFLVLLVLFIFGAATIKDFAFVLLMGVIIGTYSSIFIVATVVYDWEKRFPTPIGKSRA
ncbi:protein translocase subunit SecF [candidate division WOR-3 bacterium]|nr:protein translocase subunit SecF [candidate division WOR-3 bacterium]